jgi:hypothetical protein
VNKNKISSSFGQNITRREALRYGLLGFSGLALAGMFPLRAAPVTKRAKAKSVIQIWQWGGPSHLDTFDPKPEAGYDYCGPFNKPIETNVKGIRICELLPLTAKQADKYSIIRSMTHGINAHETAAYVVQTGWKPEDGFVHPCAGAVVSFEKGYDAGYKGLTPPYIVVTNPQGRFSEAGFLGSKYKPFATGGNPNSEPFTVEGIVTPGITKQRQMDRRQLLNQLDGFAKKLNGNSFVDLALNSEQSAYELILGNSGKVFDLSAEDQKLRDKYGRNSFGQSCLLARRLVEAGVPYITINYPGWDTHKQNFETMRTKLPEFDKGFSSLLRDLADKGLLDSTIVWCGGEFGRTPKIAWEEPWNGGRHHHGQVFCSVVAGGGFKPGHVVGSSNSTGTEVADHPVYPWDLLSSIYQLMGIAPEETLPHPQGLKIPLTPPVAEGIKYSDSLKEIM